MRRSVVAHQPRQGFSPLRNERAARLVGLIAAALMIAVILSAARAVVPLPDSRSEIRLYEVPPGGPVIEDWHTLPVFVMREGRGAIRHGTATLRPDGRLRVELFTTPLAEAAEATEPLLFAPDVTALWVAASDASRAELRARLVAAQDGVAHTLERIMASEAFAREYRPILREIMSDAITGAWEDPRSREAFDALAEMVRRIARYDLSSRIEAVIDDRVESAVWSFLETNWAWLPTVPFGGELDYTPLAGIVEDTLADPAFRDTVSALVLRVLELDETRLLAERMAIVAVDALLRDARIADVTAAMVADPRLRDAVQPLADEVLALVGAVPRHLGGLGNENDLNPLAAHVFKAMTLDARVGFVMYVTPERLRVIHRIAPDAGLLLSEVPAS